MSINANYNLPPGVLDSDPNAPWNAPEPPPEDVCPECGSDNTFEANTKVINRGVWKIKRMYICRNCWNKFDGDGVYASFDGYQIWLSANHQNEIKSKIKK